MSSERLSPINRREGMSNATVIRLAERLSLPMPTEREKRASTARCNADDDRLFSSLQSESKLWAEFGLILPPSLPRSRFLFRARAKRSINASIGEIRRRAQLQSSILSVFVCRAEELSQRVKPFARSTERRRTTDLLAFSFQSFRSCLHLSSFNSSPRSSPSPSPRVD